MDTRDASTYKRIKYFCIIGMLFFGTCSTLVAKHLDNSSFSYELFQTMIMFIGEFLCIFYVIYRKFSPTKVSPRKSSGGRQPLFLSLGKKVFAISGLCDFFGSYLQAICYNLLSSPAIMAFKMLMILNIFIYRFLIIKRKIYRHQVLGLSLLVLGFLLIALIVLTNPEGGEDSYNQPSMLVGMALMFIAQIFNILNFISTEYFMWKVKVEAEEVLAIKGISGIIICVVAYVPLQFIYPQDSEESSLWNPFRYLGEHASLAPFLVIFAFIACMYNYFITKIIQVTDSLSACTLDSGRMITYWAISFAFISRAPATLEIIGAILLTAGICIYNEIFIIRWWGFEKAAKKNLKENDIYKEIRQRSREWQTRLESLVIE